MLSSARSNFGIRSRLNLTRGCSGRRRASQFVLTGCFQSRWSKAVSPSAPIFAVRLSYGENWIRMKAPHAVWYAPANIRAQAPTIPRSLSLLKVRQPRGSPMQAALQMPRAFSLIINCLTAGLGLGFGGFEIDRPAICRTWSFLIVTSFGAELLLDLLGRTAGLRAPRAAHGQDSRLLHQGRHPQQSDSLVEFVPIRSGEQQDFPVLPLLVPHPPVPAERLKEGD